MPDSKERTLAALGGIVEELNITLNETVVDGLNWAAMPPVVAELGASQEIISAITLLVHYLGMTTIKMNEVSRLLRGLEATDTEWPH